MRSRSCFAGQFAGAMVVLVSACLISSKAAGRKGASSQERILGWGGVVWGASDKAVLEKYPTATVLQPDPTKQDFSLALRPRMNMDSELGAPTSEVAVPGVDVSGVVFKFKDGKLVSLSIAGTLVGDLAGPVVRKYGPAQESTKRSAAFDEESDNVWRDKQGNGLVLRMFMKSHSIYLDYYSATAMKQRDKEEGDRRRKEESSL